MSTMPLHANILKSFLSNFTVRNIEIRSFYQQKKKFLCN
ncbi:hypothetical protein LSO9J_20079 [Candidatus Liberibacter solanacearum]